MYGLGASMKEGERMRQEDKQPIGGEDWDVVTTTTDGGVIWRRYGDRKIVVTSADELPQDILARQEELRQ